MRHSRLLFLTLPLLLGACRDSKIAVYQIPKDNDATAPAAASAPPAGDMAGTPIAKSDGTGLAWTAPAHWQSRPASGMRKATYVVAEGAEMAVTAFPGDVGGELANLNRWRGQLGVAPITEADLPAAVTRLTAGGLQIIVVDILGGTPAKPARLLGAIVPHGGSTWFFKLTGPVDLVAREKPAFLDFLQSLQAP